MKTTTDAARGQYRDSRQTARRIVRQALCLARLALVLLVLCASASRPALAEDYPEKGRPIRIIVPSGAGSALDLVARSYAKALSESMGLSVFVDNKPGADGTIGIQAFLSTPPDGYTILMLSSSWSVLAPIINPKLPYSPLRDFVPLITTSRAGIVMSMSSNSPYKSVSEFVTAARANPEKFTCATASPTLRLACEHLQASAGIKLLLVPYKTTAAANLAVASGETDVIFADAGSFITLWQVGRLKGTAFATQERSASFPDIPTMREEGLPDFEMNAWYGYYFRTGTPAPIAETMRGLLRKASATQSVKDALKTFVHEQMNLSGDEITALTRSETERWSRLVRERNIKFSE